MDEAGYPPGVDIASEPLKPVRVSRRQRILGLRLPIWVLILLILALLAASIVLFGNGFGNDVDARFLALFAVAGCLGGALRSFAYSLASGSFTERERRQWSTEAIVGPVTGAIAGMLAYLVVRASLVASPVDLTREGQYIISLIAGALALRPLGSVVERGLLRSSMSRSGILGGEISPSVPLLDRIETVLEQRVTESSLANYDGWVEVTPSAVGPGQWSLQVTLQSSGSDEPLDSRNYDPHRQSARIVVIGGEDRDAVLFGISIASRTFEASPPLLAISAPRQGRAHEATIYLETEEAERAPAGESVPPNRAVLVEIGQGTKTLTVVRVPLEGTTAVAAPARPSPVESSS